MLTCASAAVAPLHLLLRYSLLLMVSPRAPLSQHSPLFPLSVLSQPPHPAAAAAASVGHIVGKGEPITTLATLIIPLIIPVTTPLTTRATAPSPHSQHYRHAPSPPQPPASPPLAHHFLTSSSPLPQHLLCTSSPFLHQLLTAH